MVRHGNKINRRESIFMQKFSSFCTYEPIRTQNGENETRKVIYIQEKVLFPSLVINYIYSATRKEPMDKVIPKRVTSVNKKGK